MSKKGSKLLTGIIAFFLGFLFAILVEVGAVFGIYWYVTSTDLDSVMNTLGIPNKDENGNNKYINTDPENGGVTNIKELVAALQWIIYENGELAIIGKSFDDIETLIPATNIVLGMVYDAIGDYIEIDKDEFESTPMSNLPQFLTDSIMDIKTASVMTKMGMDAFVGEDANGLIKAIVMGAECEYATVTYGGESQSEFKLPVFYDIYDKDEELGFGRKQYVRNSSGNTNRYPENLSEDFLCETQRRDDEGNSYTEYVLYYVPCRVNLNEGKIEEAVYTTKEITVEAEGKTKRISVLEYGEDTEFIVVSSERGEDGNFVLNFDAVKAAHENCEEGKRHALQYYEEYGRTYYNTDKDGNVVYPLSTISGKNFFYDNAKQLVQMNALTVGDIMEDPFKPLYSVTIKSIIGEDSDVVSKLFSDYSVGELLDGKVPFDEIADDLQVSVFINNVKPDNRVMAYMVHRISDLEIQPDGTYKAIYDKKGENETPVTVTLDSDGYISRVIAPDGRVLDGVLVNEAAALTSDMASVLTLSDVITLEESNKIIDAIKDIPLDEIGSKINSLTVSDVFTEEEIEHNAILRQLKTTHIDELSTAIDNLLIQAIYDAEVYGLPEDAEGKPSEVTEFNENFIYYVSEDDGETLKIADINCEGLEEGTTKYDDELGHLTEEQYKD